MVLLVKPLVPKVPLLMPLLLTVLEPTVRGLRPVLVAMRGLWPLAVVSPSLRGNCERGPWQVIKDRAEGPVAGGTARPVAGDAVEDANPSEGPLSRTCEVCGGAGGQRNLRRQRGQRPRRPDTHFLYKAGLQALPVREW